MASEEKRHSGPPPPLKFRERRLGRLYAVMFVTVAAALALVGWQWNALPRSAIAYHTWYVCRASDCVLGKELRTRAMTRKKAVLMRYGFNAVDEVPLWSFRLATYLWDWYTPYWPCTERERIGRAGDGGKWVCGTGVIKQIPDCVVYSYGVNDDISFEEELLDSTQCECPGLDDVNASTLMARCVLH
jgi:hypothetical protein